MRHHHVDLAVEDFCVELECFFTVAIEVEVGLNLHVSAPSRFLGAAFLPLYIYVE
jgi:hypothetical protein